MAPSFIERMRQRGITAEPPQENPGDVAAASWANLREYAIKALALAHETNEVNNMLTAENESLRRENGRLSEQLAQISREHRAANAFAQSLRTRVVAMREQFDSLEREAIHGAQAAMREPETATEQREAAEVVGNITRINPHPHDLDEPISPPAVSWAGGR